MICGHCGHLNEDEARCIRCGRRLDDRVIDFDPGTFTIDKAPWGQARPGGKNCSVG